MISNAAAVLRPALLAICLLAAACASQKQPAQTLIDEIDLTIAGSAEDAAKYAPTQLREVRGELDSLKRSFDQGDYAGVLSRGPKVLSVAGDLIGATAAARIDRNRELSSEWSALAESLPNRMSALETRVDRLGKRPRDKAAAGADSEARDQAAAARAALKDIYGLWSKARSAFASRNLEEAAKTANEVRTKIDALSDTLSASDP